MCVLNETRATQERVEKNGDPRLQKMEQFNRRRKSESKGE